MAPLGAPLPAGPYYPPSSPAKGRAGAQYLALQPGGSSHLPYTHSAGGKTETWRGQSNLSRASCCSHSLMDQGGLVTGSGCPLKPPSSSSMGLIPGSASALRKRAQHPDAPPAGRSHSHMGHLPQDTLRQSPRAGLWSTLGSAAILWQVDETRVLPASA